MPLCNVAMPSLMSTTGKFQYCMISIFLCVAYIPYVASNLLIPGKTTQHVLLTNNSYQYLGFPTSALNGTEVEIVISCSDSVDFKYEAQFVLRSSPCDKEFFNTNNPDILVSHLKFYFNDHDHTPPDYDYDKIVWYKSSLQNMSCKSFASPFLETATSSMITKNVTRARAKRGTFPGVNGNSIDGGAKLSLTSWHPAQTIPVDGIYILVLRLNAVSFPNGATSQPIVVTVEWRGRHGFLSAIDYPLLRFYILMCVFYAVIALVWLALCIKYYKDLLRIQFWIGAVILVGMLEKAFFLSEYTTMNANGRSDGVIEFAELVSCAKRTMARVLVIIVSVGYGVVKPRLGNTLSQVAGVGLVYFVFSAIEALSRVSQNQLEAQKQKQLASIPLAITDVAIFYWIYTSLGTTMTTLRIRRNSVKLAVYRHFANTLLFAVVSSLCFMIWSMMYHIFPSCLKEWKGLWIDTAFWHVLFCGILVVIMILWRPSNNNQCYAFTPLLDDSEDENDQDKVFNAQAYEYGNAKQRETGQMAANRRQNERDSNDQRLEEDLRWIENHIPASLTDHLLIDEEEEREVRALEQSKML